MAQYRFSVSSPISRGKGQSAVAKAAYNARAALRDERTGELKDFSLKHDEILFSAIFVDPKRNAPEWAQDRAALWNAASAAEKRKDAREAQEIILNLPHELNPQQREWLLKDFVREQLTRSTGRVADVNLHAAPTHGDDRNIHAHILFSLRSIGPDGFAERLPEVTPEQIARWRERWAEMGARALDRAGFHQEAERYRVEHLSLERQRQAALERGDLAYAETLNREATRHLGPQAAAMERKGLETDRGNIYRDTVERNDALVGLKAELAAVEKEIARERDRALAPEGLNPVAADIWLAWQRSDNAQAFRAALADNGMELARVTKEEARASEVDAFHARQQGRFAPTYSEGELVVVTDHVQVYRLTQRTTGNGFRDIQQFMRALEPSKVQGLDATKQLVQERADLHEIERQAFRDLSGIGLLKHPKEPQLGKEAVERDVSAAPLTKAAGKALEGIANLVTDATEMVFDFFGGATEMTPERIAASIDAKQQRVEQAKIDMERFRSDAEYRRQVEAQEAQKLEAEQRAYYEKQRERDDGLQR